jgi:tetratricopeptide (TPR) repeat protein
MRAHKQYVDALVLAERMIDRYPADINLLKERAWLNQDRGDRALALQNFFDILEIYPDNDTVINSMGVLYQYTGMLDSALSCYSRCLSLAKSGKDSFGANVNIGSVYIFQQEYEKAIGHYERMYRQYPDSLDVLANLAQSYAYNLQQDKAATLMETIIRRNARFPGGYNNLGLLYTEMGNYESAKAAFDKGIALEANDPYLHNNYGYLLYKLKDYRKALLHINRSIALAESPYAYRNRALVYIDMKLMKEACADLDASSDLGFKTFYGNEVNELKAKYCSQ